MEKTLRGGRVARRRETKACTATLSCFPANSIIPFTPVNISGSDGWRDEIQPTPPPPARDDSIITARLEKSGAHWSSFRNEIMSSLQAQDYLPERLLVDHEDAALLAGPIAAALGISLQRVARLPVFLAVFEDMMASMRRRAFPGA